MILIVTKIVSSMIRIMEDFLRYLFSNEKTKVNKQSYSRSWLKGKKSRNMTSVCVIILGVF